MTYELPVFDVLAHRRRRWIIGVLAISPAETISVRDLAGSLAEFEHQNPTTMETKRIRTSLRRTHLARLEAVDAITVTQDAVSRSDAFWAIFSVLSEGLSCGRSPT